MAAVNEIWAAYEDAQGEWSGCDWPTHFGSLALDLNGVSSGEASRIETRWRAIAGGEAPGEGVTAAEGGALADMALHLRLRGAVACLGEGNWSRQGGSVPTTRRACAEALAGEWELAACLLAEIESDARWAEREAYDAVRAAQSGDWDRALRHARRASTIEAGYFALHLWGRLDEVIQRRAAEAGASGQSGRDDPISDLG